MPDPKLPQFIIIGAMKCATSSLHEQLAVQEGIFMSALKEPNFFSDDGQYAKGKNWYGELFAAASPGDLKGESSTHYTKLPVYPNTVARMKELLPEVKLIYIMRHPVDRLISHYIHEWSQGVISCDINQALQDYPELIAYSSYAYQLEPFLAAYGRDKVLPIFFESIKSSPQPELDKVCNFIGYKHSARWNTDQAPSNVSKERIRKFPMYDLLIESAPLRVLRRALIPRKIRDRVKSRFQMQDRPLINATNLAYLEKLFDEDLNKLGNWLGVELNCQNFRSVVNAGELQWKT